jgi:hypothetical protein
MLERVLRPEPGGQRLTQAVKLFGIRTSKKSTPCRQPVDVGILAAPRLAILGARTGARLRIQAVRFAAAFAGWTMGLQARPAPKLARAKAPESWGQPWLRGRSRPCLTLT